MMWSNWGWPISPLATAWRMRAKLASKRRLKPICSLTPAFVHGCQRVVDHGQIVVDGFLAEDVLARRRSLDDDLGMGVGGRADDDGIDGRAVDDHVIVLHREVDAELVGRTLGRGFVDVGHEQTAGVGDARGDVCGVHASDATGADESEIELS